LTIAFSLSVAAPGAIAQEPPPTPSPTPEPSSEPSPDPSPEPSPEPSPSPDPTSSPPPTPDPAPTSPPRNPPLPADDPITSGGAPGETDTPLSTDGVTLSPFEAALSLLGGSTGQEDASSPRVGTGSLFETVGSIIDELTSSNDPAIRAAEAPSTCPGSACLSSTDAKGTRTSFIVLICLAIAIAGALVIRAMSRRSTTPPLSDRP
jgi:outer membrane biosynthesis protein TonB